MVPVGYMAKHVRTKPDWLKAPQVKDIYSVSNCVSEDFADYISLWKHNGYWFFDTPEVIRATARENAIRLQRTSLFYYEAYEVQFDGKRWRTYGPAPGIETNIVSPSAKQLEGFDVVTFSAENAAECSPLSCNGLAEHLPTNEHCLLTSFGEAEANIENGFVLQKGEPGPWRIFAVYSVDWPTAR
jgi:hypothetical protein